MNPMWFSPERLLPRRLCAYDWYCFMLTMSALVHNQCFSNVAKERFLVWNRLFVLRCLTLTYPLTRIAGMKGGGAARLRPRTTNVVIVLIPVSIHGATTDFVSCVVVFFYETVAP
jgi:hypothetical protein